MLNREDEWMAAIVDQVLDVRPVAPGDVAAPPPLVRGLAGDYLRGVIRRDGGLVVVLDVHRILGATDALSLREVLEVVQSDAAGTVVNERVRGAGE